MKPSFLDLFSGAGLFSEGFVRAGFEPKLAIELAPEAVHSYNRNIANCAVRASVYDVRNAPKVDVLIAGPPCQGFSTLGRRDPTDQRNELSLAILPWVAAAAPRVVVVENVPPFLKSPQWKRLTAALVDMNFSLQTWELEASDFGAPQRRRRAFTIASKVGHISEPACRIAPVAAGKVLLDPSNPIQSDDPMHTWPLPKGIAAERISLVPPRGDRRDIIKGAPHLCPPSWFKVGCQATDVWGRIDPNMPSNTLRCTFQNPSKGRYLHPIEDRVLSLREGARLQGVPDSWVFTGRPYPVARQIGNGVPVPLATAVGSAISEVLS